VGLRRSKMTRMVIGLMAWLLAEVRPLPGLWMLRLPLSLLCPLRPPARSAAPDFVAISGGRGENAYNVCACGEEFGTRLRGLGSIPSLRICG